MINLDTTTNAQIETIRCAASPLYFVLHYSQIYDNETKRWIPFELWREQVDALFMFHENQKVIALKARQLGMSWLALAYALWQMLFEPIATVLIFSKDETSAIYLLGDERLRGMYRRLPAFLQCGESLDNAKTWMLANGSTARAFAKTGGDSYSATLAIVDEADVVPNLNVMMRAISPTIDTGGKLFLISRADKSKPESEFKNIYKSAKKGENGYAWTFLPWWVRPERTPEWYEKQKRDVLAQTGSLDDLHEQYPANDAEALAPRSLDKRIPPMWINQCYFEESGHTFPAAPNINGLRVHRQPETGKSYDIGADPAEGNPTSDDSAAVVLCRETGEEMARLRGKFQPSTLAAHIDKLGTYYNGAGVMVERNNHGHAVLLWLRDNSALEILKGWDDKEGWLSNSKGKALMYDDCADYFHDQSTTVHSFDVWEQLISIEGSSLRAPEGQMDDLADAYTLAIQGTKARHKRRNRLSVSASGLFDD